MATTSPDKTSAVSYNSVKINGVDIFYREAGPATGPTLLLLHGFPSSSHMFRNLIPLLSDNYHVIAPDFPGYGQSSAPAVDQFDYTYDHMTEIVERLTEELGVKSYAIYLSDIGASVGFRLAVRHPERVTGLIIQNGEAYLEGINKEFFKPLFDYWEDRTPENEKPLLDWLLTVEGTKWHYVHGARNERLVSPDNWTLDQALQDRPGNKAIQLQILYDTKTNLDSYASFQAYFKKHQPPTLIVWGKNDGIFTVEGVRSYQRDLPDAEVHLFDTGHFALEEDVEAIGPLIHDFLDRKVRAGADIGRAA